MLANPKNDLFHFLTILESMGKIDTYLNNISSADEFIEKDDQIYFNATLTLLTNIGEVFGKISSESKEYINEMDLKGIRGIRNRIVHDYSGIDSFRIYEIILNHLPTLKKQVLDLLSKYIKENLIDVEEYNIAEKSKYYKHIDFKQINKNIYH